MKIFLPFFLLFLVAGAEKCPPPTPTPTPTPVPTPTPTPTPTPVPTPTPSCPSSLDKFNPLAVRNQSAWIVDATPQTCNAQWCGDNGFPGQICCPMGQEGTSQRSVCEQLFAPYTWYLNGTLCTDQCWNNNGNNLQERVPKPTTGGTITIKAGNGVMESGTIPSS
jgi:hypothetical protein